MREPTEEEYTMGLESMGLDPKSDATDCPKDAVRLILAGAWAAAEANLGGRCAALVKTRIEEAALWVGRTSER